MMQWRRLRQFAEDRQGVAAVEFALILPILLLLYFGTIETASLYAVDRRVATIAGTMGDLVSRTKDTLETDTLNDYFQAASGIIRPYGTFGLSQVVSFISVDEDGVTEVEWSRGFNGSTARTAGDEFPLDSTAEINLLAREGFLVVAEVDYSYLPLFGIVIPNAINLSHTDFFLPRFGQFINMD